ncbi:MAG: SusC/RagA family TonB-linked outer membrane protein [Bacteroidales bacterium]
MMKFIYCKMNIRGIAIIILLTSSFIFTHAQDSIQITGVVISLDKKPVANASVSVEGSFDMPTLTNTSGEFSVMAPRGEAWIMVNPTGDLKPKRVYINNRRSLSIMLTPEDLPSSDDLLKIMDQVMPRNEVVASHFDLRVENIEHTNSMSLDQFMQGKVPGMRVVNRSGAPGSGAVLTLRGINSIYSSNQPFIIIDGIPLASQNLFESNLAGYEFNPLMAVNNLDISRVVVVRDPTVTVAYGSKASNGIVFIETLDPSTTQTTIEIDYRNGFSLRPEKQIPVLNAGQHRTLMSEILFSSPMREEVIEEEYPNLFLEEGDDRYIEYQHNTNWQDLIFDNAVLTNFNLNVKGGDEIARYGLSFGYTDAEGVVKNTGYQGYNLRFVSMLNIFTWLKMDAGVSLNYSFSEMKEAATVKQTSPILSSLTKSPLLNPYQYDIEGNMLYTILSEVDELGVSNPLATINNFHASNSNYNFSASLGLTGSLNNFMTINSKFNFNYNVLKEFIFMPNKGMEHYYNNEAINVAKLTNNSLNSFYNNSYLNYSRIFNGLHRISSNTGLNLQANNFEYDWGLTKNAHENDQYRMIQDGQNNLREIGGKNRKWNWLSFYEYINYSYNNRYMASLSVSLDGSSRVGDNAANTIDLGVPFGLFYAGGVAWRVSQESFMKELSWIDDLKIRFTAGKSGNDDIGEANATNYYQAIKFRETVGLFPATIVNDKLTYESVTQFNAGIDFSTAGNRFNASIDLYQSTTNDMLIYSPIESYLGYDLRIENGGQMSNKGFELYALYRILDVGSFKWDVSASLSNNSNRITTIKGDMLSYNVAGGQRVNMVGEEANSFYGYIYDGVFSTQAEANEAGLVNDRNLPYQAGDAIFRDISGPNGEPDSIINDYDKTIIGSSLPQFYGGFETSLSYKRFTLGIVFQFVYGNNIFNYVRYQNERMSTLDNQSSSTLNRWQFDGHITDIPRAAYDDLIGNSDFSTRWIEDGSYARLKNISLSYKMPDEFLVFRAAEIYISVNNLFTLSKYLGYYPEFAFSYSQIHQGIDYGLMPQSTQFIAGIKLGL